MLSFSTICSNEFSILIRSRLQTGCLIVFILLGAYSIYYGHATIANDQKRIAYVKDSVQAAQANRASMLSTDTTTAPGKFKWETAAMPSLVRFNYNFVVYNAPTPLAALSVGQRDLYPVYYILNAQSFNVQTMKGEISNPFKLSAGHFDLAFVLVYLLPLLVVALGFDLLSAEAEMGTMPLLRVSNFPLRRIILQKLVFRFLITSSLVVLLLLLAVGVSGGAVAASDALLWLLTVICYNLLWHGIVLLINSFNRSSAFNSIAALATWVVLLVVVPAALNAAIKDMQHNAVDLSTLMRSRRMEESDTAMNQALNEFYRYFPERRPAAGALRPRFFQIQGYSAYLYNTDQAAARLTDDFETGIRHSAEQLNRFQLINPAANVLDILNDLSHTDLSSMLAFKSDIAAFHKNIFWFSNTAVFEDRYMTVKDYAGAPVYQTQVKPVAARRVLSQLLSVLLLTAFCFGLGALNLREKNLYK
jgi:ABC-2 type transport system permease protein